MNNFASDFAINSVKTLIDNCRCVNCDHLNLVRHTFSCGHSVCEICVEISNTCVLCSPTSSFALPVIDKPQTDRVQHASELLNSFQSLFDVDVFRKQRISEKLKEEKKIFPKCIQAPIKYYNKRKSSIFIEKENIQPSLLPGENILANEAVRMEKSKTYVQQWLNQNQQNFSKDKKARLPFTDLSTNSSNSSNLLRNKQDNIGRKRKLNKTACTTPTSIYKTRCKKNRVYSAQKCQNHESGIELDDNICFINDSQSETLYKDKDAQIAVLEADKKYNSAMGESVYDNKDIINNIEYNDSFNLRKDHFKIVPSRSKSMPTSPYKIPFYKKSKLFDPCKLCAKFTDENLTNVIKMKNVTITIDNPSFITTINISEDTKHVPKFKAIGIQTQKFELHEEEPATEMDSCKKDIGAGENFHKKTNEHPIKDSCQIIHKAKGIVIEDSDCDSSDEASAEVEVKADIHRACKYEDYVFKQLESHEYENRVIPRVRGKTPASSDSSDKENYNPNRKKQKLSSKKKKK